jgi:hypothetical protein
MTGVSANVDLRVVELASHRLVERELQDTQIVFGDATPLRVLTANGFAGGTGVVDDNQDVGAGLGCGGTWDGQSDGARNHKNRDRQHAQKTRTTHWGDYGGKPEQVWCQCE